MLQWTVYKLQIATYNWTLTIKMFNICAKYNFQFTTYYLQTMLYKTENNLHVLQVTKSEVQITTRHIRITLYTAQITADNLPFTIWYVLYIMHTLQCTLQQMQNT